MIQTEMKLENQPDLIARMYKIHHTKLLNALKEWQDSSFEWVTESIHIEFHKCILPHSHYQIILWDKDKKL